METASIESLCTLLGRSRLLSAEEVPGARQRWLREAGENAGEPAAFCKWLVAKQYLTEYQAGLLLRGKADRFFLGDYKLLDRIGVGRMAGVYKAVHRLGAAVAIKVLPPSKAKDKNAFGRFQREGRLAARLKHANIVRTYEIAEDNGLHYLVMEYLEGETLSEVLKRRGKLPPPEAVRLIHQALLGLECLHEQDMIHRDLSPGNLMLAVSDSTEEAKDTMKATVKILDIGMGRALFDEEAGGDDANLTAAGDVLGTPDYMAPEQARDAHAADIRSDIYSLGCTLFHALAGKPPFPDSNMVRKMMRHATEPVPALKQFNPAVPDGLQHIVNSTMAKDPAQRYPTPQRAAQALQAFLAAGAETASREVPAKMRAYLDWLDSSGDKAPLAVARPVAPAASVPLAMPVAAPVAIAPPTPAAKSNVEPVVVAAKGKLALGGLSRRDALMLWVGAGFLAVAGGAALILQRIMRKKKEQTEQQELKED